MLKRSKLFWLSGFACWVGLGFGCASQQRIGSASIPVKAMANEESPAPKEAIKDYGYCIVQKNDCLWTIAGQRRVYGDSFEWPLIFKTNRDEIKDPDLIYPRQVLRVDRGPTIEERNHARQMAMATPKYMPHPKAREALPVDYF